MQYEGQWRVGIFQKEKKKERKFPHHLTTEMQRKCALILDPFPSYPHIFSISSAASRYNLLRKREREQFHFFPHSV